MQKVERNESSLTKSFDSSSSVNTWRSPDPINLSVSFHRQIKFLLVFQDSHGIDGPEAALVTDTSQDVKVLGGSQNETHTSVIFSRNWQTCDPQDHRLTVRLRARTAPLSYDLPGRSSIYRFLPPIVPRFFLLFVETIPFLYLIFLVLVRSYATWTRVYG